MVAILDKMKDPGEVTRIMIGVLIGLTMYPVVRDSAEDLKQVSYYIYDSTTGECTAANKDDPGAEALAPYQDILYDLVPLSFAWFLMDTILNVDKGGIKDIAMVSIQFSVGSIIILGLLEGFTPQVAEAICEAKQGSGIADTIMGLLGYVYPLLPAGAFGGVEALTRFTRKK